MSFRLLADVPTFDFFKPLRFWLAVSILGVLLTVVVLPIRGLNYGVDFLGGTLILAEFPEHRDVGPDLREQAGDDGGDAVEMAGPGAAVQALGRRAGANRRFGAVRVHGLDVGRPEDRDSGRIQHRRVRRLADRAAVVHGAEGDGVLRAGDRRHDGLAARREHELVGVLDRSGVAEGHHAPALGVCVVDLVDLEGDGCAPVMGCHDARCRGAEDDRLADHAVVDGQDARTRRCAQRDATEWEPAQVGSGMADSAGPNALRGAR